MNDLVRGSDIYHGNTRQHSHVATWADGGDECACRQCDEVLEADARRLVIHWRQSGLFYGVVCAPCALTALNGDCTIRYAFPVVLDELVRGYKVTRKLTRSGN